MFLLFQSSAERELSSQCHRAVLFLTDGHRSAKQLKKGDDAQLQTDIEKWRTDPIYGIEGRPRIFTYSLGKDADRVQTKKIACTSGGFYQHIEKDDTSNLVSCNSF